MYIIIRGDTSGAYNINKVNPFDVIYYNMYWVVSRPIYIYRYVGILIFRPIQFV